MESLSNASKLSPESFLNQKKNSLTVYLAGVRRQWKQAWVAAEGLSRLDRDLLEQLKIHFGARTWCWASQQRLADKLQVCRKTIGRRLAHLEALGWVVRSRRHNRSGNRTSDRIDLAWPSHLPVPEGVRQIQEPPPPDQNRHGIDAVQADVFLCPDRTVLRDKLSPGPGDNLSQEAFFPSETLKEKSRAAHGSSQGPDGAGAALETGGGWSEEVAPMAMAWVELLDARWGGQVGYRPAPFPAQHRLAGYSTEVLWTALAWMLYKLRRRADMGPVARLDAYYLHLVRVANQDPGVVRGDEQWRCQRYDLEGLQRIKQGEHPEDCSLASSWRNQVPETARGYGAGGAIEPDHALDPVGLAPDEHTTWEALEPPEEEKSEPACLPACLDFSSPEGPRAQPAGSDVPRVGAGLDRLKEPERFEPEPERFTPAPMVVLDRVSVCDDRSWEQEVRRLAGAHGPQGLKVLAAALVPVVPQQRWYRAAHVWASVWMLAWPGWCEAQGPDLLDDLASLLEVADGGV